MSNIGMTQFKEEEIGHVFYFLNILARTYRLSPRAYDYAYNTLFGYEAYK